MPITDPIPGTGPVIKPQPRPDEVSGNIKLQNMNTQKEYAFGNDPIVIRKELDDLKGGVVLDTTGYTEDFIYAGHPVIRDTETGLTFKPFPVADGALGTLPEGYEYAGVVIRTKPASEPFVSVLTAGEVNDKALKFPLTAEIKEAFKADVPTIRWEHDV